MIKHQQVHGKATKTQRQTKLSNVSMGIGELQPISSKNPPGRQKTQSGLDSLKLVLLSLYNIAETQCPLWNVQFFTYNSFFITDHRKITRKHKTLVFGLLNKPRNFVIRKIQISTSGPELQATYYFRNLPNFLKSLPEIARRVSDA